MQGRDRIVAAGEAQSLGGDRGAGREGESFEVAISRDHAALEDDLGVDAVEAHETELHGGRRRAVPELEQRFGNEFFPGDGLDGVGELPAAHHERDGAGHGFGLRQREAPELDGRGRVVA